MTYSHGGHHRRPRPCRGRSRPLTDESMQERIARRFMLDWECEVHPDSEGDGWHCNLHTSEAPNGICRSATFDAESAVAEFRVAAGEQEAGR